MMRPAQSPSPNTRRRALRPDRARAFAALLSVVTVLFSYGCVQRDVLAVTVAKVIVLPGATSLLEGETQQFTSTVEDETGRALRGATVTWSVDDPEYLSIDASGMGEALLKGTTTVRATFRGVSGAGTVTVIAAPAIEAQPDSVAIFGAAGGPDPAPIEVDIGNAGGGTISGLSSEVRYAAGQPTGWLTATLRRTNTPTSLDVQADIDGLPVGIYDANVALSSPDDEDSPVLVPVTLSLTGVTVTQTGGSSVVTEAGVTDTLRVVLDAMPDSAVVLDVLTGDPGEVVPTPSTLTFGPADWNVPQIIVLTGQDEVVSDGDQVTPITVRVDDDLSDARYDPIEDVVVDVTVVDDDAPSFTLTETGGTTAVDESGSTDDFTVVLDVEPLSTVVLNVTWSDPTEIAAGPTSVTFTPADWATPQTITVTGVSDDLIDGTQTSYVRLAVDAASSDDAFDTLPPDSVSVTTADDDAAGFTVVESPPPPGGATLVAESGTTDDFTVVLDAEPTSNVILSVVSDDPGEATVSAPVIVFTPANWDTPVTITVTGIDDDLIDGDQSTDVTIAVDPSSDDDFDALPPVVVNVTTTDDESAGFVIAESGGVTSVTEAGSTDDFTVVLTAQPVANVVLDVASDDTGEVTISAASLTFTPGNWDAPQTITVTGIDELIDDGDQTTNVRLAIDAAASDDDFDALLPDSVVVTTIDDDAAGFVITESGGGTLVTEGGSTDDFTVVLTSQPIENVVITLTAADASEASVSPISLTFTPANWNVAQTVTVTGVDDLEDDEDQFSLIAIAVSEALSDAAYDPLPDQTITVTTTDNDSPAGFTVTAIGGTTVGEGGSTDDFTVVLDTEPSSDVVFDVSSGDPTEASVSVATLTFTNTNWDTPQTVTVTGVDDDVIDGTVVSVITVAVNDASSDDAFDPLPDQTLNVSTLDDDVAGFTVVESDGSTLVGEGGSTDAFTVVLDAEPSSDVVISVTSGDLSEASVAPTALTFTPGNWNTTQTVTVTGVDDLALDGTQVTAITLAVVDGSSDDAFDGVADQTVTVQTTDNDAPGITLTETGPGTSVTEAGGTDDFTVVLNAQPATDVVLNVGSGDVGEVTVVPTTLTFTSLDWETPKSVVLTGVDDDLIDGDVSTVVTVSVDDALSDDLYDPVADETLTVTTVDDDAAGFTIVESGAGTVVSESGSTDVFTVVLDAQPASAVRLLITAADPSEVATSAPLTFTGANWDVPQTVTLTGVDDALIDGDLVTLVTVSVDDPGSDDAYDDVPDQSVSVTTTDDDLASFIVTESGGGTLVSESGGQDDFTVVLGSQPTSNVVLDITSADFGEAVASPTSLTFTPSDWDTPRTVTVTGVNDPLIDGDQLTALVIAVNDAASDDDFDGLADQTVSVTTTDDDAAGFDVTETDGTTAVTEAGTTDAFDVVLTSQPLSDVVLDLTNGDPTEVALSAPSLTFTSANWDTPQTVTVTGVDDFIDDGNQITTLTIAVNAAASDPLFGSVPPQNVDAVTSDDDTAGFTVAETGGTLVTEAGSTDVFTVVLDTEPVSNVELTVVSGDTGEVTVAPARLVFTPSDWDTPQTVTVTGVDDLIDDDAQFTSVTIAVDDAASDDPFDSVLDQIVTVTTTDDDDPVGFTVTAIGGLTVTEAGSTDDFTVVLDAQPGTDVVIDVTSGDTGEATVAPTPLTFTNGNWDIPQTVTVTGVDDDILDGIQSTTLTISVNPSSDPAFVGVPDQTQSVTTTDDDVAGFTVTESGGGTVVNEGGTTDDIDVVLDAEPATNVEIDVSSADTGEATVSPATLVFTPANWDTPQPVTVTGVDDAIIDGNQSTLVTFTIDAAASDDDFDALADQTVSVTTTDDDAPGVTVTESGGTTEVDESGTTDSFTVVLSSGPATDVVINVTSGDAGEASVAPTPLVFTPTDWFTPQTVTVTGVDDALPDGDQITLVTVAVDIGASDPAYGGVPSQTVSVTTTDDDGAGFTITESGPGTSVTEAGSTDGFDVVLDAQPATAVSLTITSGDVGEATVFPSTITFTNANWDTPQSVTVTGVDDDLIDGNQTTLVTVAVDDLSSDPAYVGVPDQTVSVTTLDDDLAGFTIVESGGGTLVNEGGSIDDFTVVLDTEPNSNVVLTVTAGDPAEATSAPPSLTFTPGNWDTPQTVTVTGVDDAIIDGSQLSLITVSVDAGASDPDYAGVADQTVSVTTNDDDGAGFLVTESGGSTFVTEAGGTDDFDVVLTAEPGSDVVLNVTPSDPSEVAVSAGSLTFTPANWDTPQTVTVSGVDDVIDDGSVVSTITISVDDAASDDDFDPLLDQSVTVTTADDDAAAFTVTESPPNTEVTEAGSSDDFTVVLDTEPESNVVLTVTSGDTGEATVSPVSLVFTPTNWNVPQPVTVTGVDDPINDGDQVTPVTISVNDGPSDDAFDPLPDQTVLVRTTDDDLAGFTIVQTGGGTSVSESGTSDDFTVVLTAEPSSNVVLLISSADLSEVTVSPAFLIFTPLDWETPKTVTVTGVDDQFDDGDRFTLVTVSVDDANSDDAYDLLADQTVSVTTIDDDGVGFTIVESDSNTTVTEAGSTDDFTVVLDAQPQSDVVLDVTSGDTGEAIVAPASLTFTNTNWDTPQTVTVTGVNDLFDDGDVITLVTVSVDAAASDDAYDLVGSQSVGVTTTDDDAAGLTVTESGLGTSVDESGTTDDFTVVLTAQPVFDVVVSITSGDTGEVTVFPTSLTFTTANWDETQLVTVTGVSDEEADGDQTTDVAVSVVAALSDDAYDPVPDEIVSVTTTDDDIASFSVAESGGTTIVAESGTTDGFTVVLGAQPATNVVISVTSGDVGEATVSASNLVFTNGNWNAPQTVTVTGVDDDVDDGDQSTTITLSVDAGASDDAFDGLADQFVSVTTTDDDAAGFTSSESGGNTTVSETGTTDEFTVVLTSEPISNVVLTVTALDATEAAVSPPTLTFTPGNWNSSQTVTVTGVDDPLVDGSVVSSVVLSVDDDASDDTYDPLADQVVSVTTTDDDGAGFAVTPSGPGTTVTEGGGTDTFEVVLTAQPDSDVEFDVSSADTDEATVSTARLIFTNANWATAQIVTVTGVDDDIVDGDQVTVLTVSVDDAASDDEFDGLPDQTLNVTTTDNDIAGFTVTESLGSTSVSETGTTDVVSVVLDAAPLSDVVVTASSADAGEATVSPASRTFTPANWNLAQDFTVTGVDDQTVDGDQSTLVTFAIDDALSDNAFDPLADETISVTTTDDDVASFTIVESDGTTVVTEGGATDDFTVVLDRQPLTNVVFDVSSADPSEATVSPALITFTPANWNVAQPITVTGVDDAVQDGDQTTNVTVSVSAPNSDDAWDPVADQTVTVTTTDDDTAGFTVVESGGTTVVDESGTTDGFTVVLNAQPASPVQLDISSSDTGESTVAPASLTFTAADWDVPQNVTVTGADDDVIDGTVGSTITISVNDAASDDAYDPVGDQTVSVTTTDDDVAGFTIVEVGGTIVSEAGTTDNFTVVLDAEPASNVEITVVIDDLGEATVAPSPLVFTPADWDLAQTVTVTGVDDAASDGNQVSTVTISVDAANSDDDFDLVPDQTVSVTTIDDDGAGFTVAQSGGSTTVTEGGSTDDFTVVLNTQPTNPVVLTIVSDDIGEATVSTGSLSFDDTDWNLPKAVTVTGVDDPNPDGNQFTTVTISVDDALSDDAYDPVADQIVTVTTLDNDIAGFQIVQSGGGTIVSETGTTDDFTVVLTAEPIGDVRLTITADDPTEASVAPLELIFTNANYATAQPVIVTGVDDALLDSFQFSTITISVDDANSDDAFDPLGDQTVSVTTTDDDAAAFTVVESGGSTDVDESGSTDSFTIQLDAQPFGDVVFNVTSGDLTEATVSPATVTFNNGNWNSPQTVTVTGVDDDVIDPGQTSVITIAVNPALSEDGFDAMPLQTVTANVADDDVAGFTVAETAGFTLVSEAGSTDLFTVVLDAEPSSNVVIDVSSPDTGEATVSPTSLIFATTNWDDPQTVTVTGVNDDVDDGDQVTLLDLVVNIGSSDPDFSGVAAQTVSVTTTDDDGAGITVVESGGTTVVAEPSGTDDFTVALAAQPLTPVVLNLASSDTDESTVSPATLNFNAVNWATPQPVVVTAANDDVDDGPQASTITISVDGTSDATYLSVPDETVAVTTTDDDVSGFTVVETGGSTDVTEGGTTDTFDVVLTSQPVVAVVIDVTSQDTGEGTVLPTSLSFDDTDWNVAKTVTVTGVDDGLLVDGDITFNVTLSINDAGSDASYDPLADQQVSVTNADDDTAGFTVTESGPGTTVDESGTTDTFEVVLTAQPETDVVFDVTSSDTGEATAGPTSLIFTNANWATPRTVTVTGVDDTPFLDGDQVSTLTVSVNAIASNDAFDLLAPQTILATTTDTDVASFTVTESGGSTSVNESGTTDFVTVALDVQPDGDVTIDVTSLDTGEVTVSPSSLLFTSANWSTGQTVTLTGVGDSPLSDGDQVTTVLFEVDATLSYDPFDGAPDESISVTTVDADIPNFLIVQSGGSTTVDETGSTDGFTVQLMTQPATDVSISVTSGDTGEATVSTSTLIFTNVNWATPQPVTVTGVDDGPLVDGAQIVSITLSIVDAVSDDEYDPVPDQTVNATNADNDVASFSVTETGGDTSVDEDGVGNTDTFDVVLGAQPETDVVIDVSAGNPGEATASPISLVFTTGTWSLAQTVTVTGVDDTPLVDGPQASNVTLSINVGGSDDLWDALGAQIVGVTTNDTDVAGFAIVESGGNTQVNEDPGAADHTDDFTVVLTAQPEGSVTFDITSDNTTEVTVSPATLTFNNSNWATPRTVTVTGVDDDVIDGTGSATITVSINQPATTPLFDGVAAQTVSVANLDDDIAGFTITETGATAVTEGAGGGNTDTFSVVLDAAPMSDVVLNVTSANINEVIVSSPTPLTFTPLNWATPQIVTVAGVDDDIDDGDQVTAVTVMVIPASSDDAFDSVPDQDVNVTTVDDDAVGITVVDGGGITVSEPNTQGTFTVVLDSEPLSNVKLDLTASDLTEATVSPASIVFSPANWDNAVTVTVTAADDDIIDGPVGSTITITVDDLNSDDSYDPLQDETVSVTTNDDDAAGFTIVESANSTSVTEGGSTDDFTVVLTAQPLSDVRLLVSSADLGEATVDQSSLIFTDQNWDTPQAILVTGVDDDFQDGDQVTAITISVDDANSDNSWDPLADQTVNATTTDDDTAGFTVSAITSNTTEAGPGSATFTVALTSEPTADVDVSVASDDPTEGVVTSAPTLTFTPTGGGTPWNTPQTVTVTGVDDPDIDGDVGYNIVTGASSADPIYDAIDPGDVAVINVDDDNAGFTITETGGTSVTEAAGAGNTDSFDVVLDARPGTPVTIFVTSANTAEVTVSVPSVTFTPGNWSLAQTITVTGVDESVDDGDQVTLITMAIDDANSDDEFDPLPDQTVSATTVDDDTAGISVNVITATTSEAGGTATFTVQLDSEPTADVSIGVSSDDPTEGLVTSPTPLIFTPTGGGTPWNTPQTVTVTGQDDALFDGDIAYNIVTSPAVSGDANYSGRDAADVSLVNTDDETDTLSLTDLGDAAPADDDGLERNIDAVPTAEQEPTR